MSSYKHRLGVIFLCAILLVGLVPGVVTAQDGAGGTTVVGPDDTVSGISGIFGTIVVEGTVTGDVSGVAGDIVVREGGVIEGDIEAAAGNIRISGTVEGDVSSGAGAIHLTRTGVIEGNVDVGAGEVRIDGRIGGDVSIGAETIRLGDDAAIDGSLTYDGDLQGNRDAVAGEITRDRSLGPSLIDNLQPFASWIFAVNAFIFNLLLGALLLGLFPRFSDRVADRVASDPLRSGLVGVAAFFGIPFLLVLIAITVIGIPISIVGFLLFLLVVWVGVVYGRFAVGYWLLSLADIENRWGALLVGLLLGVVLHLIPFVGGVLNFIIFLLGLGAFVTGLYTRRRRKSTSADTTPQETPID